MHGYVLGHLKGGGALGGGGGGGEFLVCEPLESSKTLGSICQTF